jgi:hypothetical protein
MIKIFILISFAVSQKTLNKYVVYFKKYLSVIILPKYLKK